MSAPFIGEIRAFGFNYAPRSWALCQGQLLPISSYSSVFALLSTNFGGDGVSTFGLPDLRGRLPLGQGQGTGLAPKYMGQMGGREAVTLQSSEMPSHNHGATAVLSATVGCSKSPGTESNAPGNVIAGHSNAFSESAGDTMGEDAVTVDGAVTTDHQGGSHSHDNMTPYQVINYCIALSGIWPSRT